MLLEVHCTRAQQSDVVPIERLVHPADILQSFAIMHGAVCREEAGPLLIKPDHKDVLECPDLLH